LVLFFNHIGIIGSCLRWVLVNEQVFRANSEWQRDLAGIY